MADKMQDSWVEVQEHQEGGTLVHTSSKEQLRQQLASAASEEEEVSDSEQIFQVTFQATDSTPEEEAEEGKSPPQVAASPFSIETKVGSIPACEIPEAHSISTTDSADRHGSGICSLTILVPVIILTHLAMFGIGYYLGRRWSADPVMKVFHV